MFPAKLMVTLTNKAVTTKLKRFIILFILVPQKSWIDEQTSLMI